MFLQVRGWQRGARQQDAECRPAEFSVHQQQVAPNQQSAAFRNGQAETHPRFLE
jgi:hypothetical protein